MVDFVSLLSWSSPPKSALILFALNVALWVLSRQRPFYVLSIAIAFWYLRQLWRNKIRGEVLLDPPDHEDWTTLRAYDLQHELYSKVSNYYQRWAGWRQTNHLLWTIGTCTGWLVLAKLGMEMDLTTMLFLLANGAFVVLPALEYVEGHGQLQQRSSSGEATSFTSSPPSSTTTYASPLAHPASPFYDFYEGIVTRSVSKAARSFILSTQSPALEEEESGRRKRRSGSSGPVPLGEEEERDESFALPVTRMPDHEEVNGDGGDSDPGEEFLFDAKHFDKTSSSSTSISASFEIVDDEEEL